MSSYAINKVCWRLSNEASFRLALKADLEVTLREVQPSLSEDEISAFVNGEVGKLWEWGGYQLLLQSLAQNGIGGLTREKYIASLKESQQRRASIEGT